MWNISNMYCVPNCLFLWPLNMVETYEHVASGAKPCRGIGTRAFGEALAAQLFKDRPCFYRLACTKSADQLEYQPKILTK